MKSTLVFLLLLPLARADVLHVDASAGPGGDGSSPVQAFRFLRDALATARGKDEIRIAGGIYFPDEGVGAKDNDPAESFIIPDNVRIVGGYKPRQTDGTPDPDSYPTILSGDIDRNDTDPNNNGIIGSSDDQLGKNSHHVVTIAGATERVTLEGLVITAGDAVSAPVDHAGGLLASGSTLVIDNCWFRGNRCQGRGGALHLDDCEAEFVNCDFAGNSSTNRGGAVGTLNGTDAEFINCLIRGNRSDRGGGFNFNGSTALLLNCTVSGNHGSVNGGGIQTHSSAVTVTDSVIWWNLAGNPGSRSASGASFNELSGGSVTASASSIIENGGGSDPDFANPFDPANAPDTSGDFRLSRGSPAIHSGTSTANSSGIDYDGNPRVVGPAIDLGAFEAPSFDIFVDSTAGGANDGTSWNDAFNLLQDALAVALPGDRILIARGLYTPASASHSFEVPAGIEMLGGHPIGGGPRDTRVHITILSGDVTGNDINTDGNFIAEDASQAIAPNASTIIRAASGQQLTPGNIFDGLVITAGQADGTPGAENATSRGGGVYLGNDGQPVFRNCRFSGNLGGEDGGAVFIELPPTAQLTHVGPVFDDCVFTGNQCNQRGGAVALIGGLARFENCDFVGNEAASGAALAHRTPGGDLFLGRCEFRANTVTAGGGAIFTEESTLTELENCLVVGNDGAGITLNGAMNLRGTTIAGNDGSPVFVANLGSLLVWNSIFWDNDEPFNDVPGGQLPTFHHSLVENFSDSDSGFAFDTDPNVPEGTEAAYRTEWFPDLRRLSLYWMPNPASFHLLRIIPEASNDLGITDPWRETAVRDGDVSGEFRADTQTITPRPEKQFLRLRVED